MNSRIFSMVPQSRLFNLKPEIANRLKESHSDVVWRQEERCFPYQRALSSAWESSCTPQSLLSTPEKSLCGGCLCKAASYNQVQGSQAKLE